MSKMIPPFKYEYIKLTFFEFLKNAQIAYDNLRKQMEILETSTKIAKCKSALRQNPAFAGCS